MLNVEANRYFTRDIMDTVQTVEPIKIITVHYHKCLYCTFINPVKNNYKINPVKNTIKHSVYSSGFSCIHCSTSL